MELDKRKVNSKGWLYLALIDLLKTKKIENITVSELVKHASIGRATFYRLYNSIDEILIEELQSEVQSFLEYIEDSEIFDKETYLQNFLLYWEDNSEMIEVLIKAKKISLLYQVLHEQTFPYDVSFMIGGSVHTLVNWIKKGRKLTIKEVVDQIKISLHF